MSDATLAARFVEALESAAAREAGAPTALVSITIDVMTPANDAVAEATLVRKTRTLVFMSAEAINRDGARCAAASSVHRILT